MKGKLIARIPNKLPRKRKKAYKKATNKGDYYMLRIVNEVLFEDMGIPSRFPKNINKRTKKGVIVEYW